jgi:hypothetical protein
MDEYELFDTNVREPEELSQFSQFRDCGSLFRGTGLSCVRRTSNAPNHIEATGFVTETAGSLAWRTIVGFAPTF